ncbi:g7568 [Coccomyxa viridis]|uniref:G7568 protein n=1 Tax=Coccomyxa viridis TaxID=1274662 RepID=A0ABP1G0L1_9CHLO
MMRSSAAVDRLAALAELPPNQAALWRRRIMEDGVRQAEMDAPQNLSKAERLLATGRMPASRAAAAILVKASCDTG